MSTILGRSPPARAYSIEVTCTVRRSGNRPHHWDGRRRYAVAESLDYQARVRIRVTGDPKQG